jgi:putative transposase
MVPGTFLVFGAWHLFFQNNQAKRTFSPYIRYTTLEVIPMRKKREFVEGAFYHVTSRTNDKVKVFGNKLGRKIMLMVLQEAKEKFCFRLSNFCVMPNHVHLLIQPGEGTNLSMIMHWIKTQSAKWWNNVHGSKNHLWGDRYFARVIDDPEDYEKVMRYIDHNPVTAGLCENPAEWKASGAFYKVQNLPELVDYHLMERFNYVKLLSPIPPEVARLLPPVQLEHTVRFSSVFAEAVERLYAAIPTIPNIGETESVGEPKIFLHYFTGTADYHICEYDGNDTMYGKVSFSMYPSETEYRKFSLSDLKSDRYMRLELR